MVDTKKELTSEEKIAKIKEEYFISKNPPKVCATPEDDTCESCQG